jgi:hypothetical protein
MLSYSKVVRGFANLFIVFDREQLTGGELNAYFAKAATDCKITLFEKWTFL